MSDIFKKSDSENNFKLACYTHMMHKSIERKSVFLAVYVRAVTVRTVTANIVTRGTKLVTGRTSSKETQYIEVFNLFIL